MFNIDECGLTLLVSLIFCFFERILIRQRNEEGKYLFHLRNYHFEYICKDKVEKVI